MKLNLKSDLPNYVFTYILLIYFQTIGHYCPTVLGAKAFLPVLVKNKYYNNAPQP